jgi:hypothetical protein
MQVWREPFPIAEATQINDSLDAGLSSCNGKGCGTAAVTVGVVVIRTHRVHQVIRRMNSVESGAKGIDIQHITLQDFGAAAKACAEEFRAAGKAAYTPAFSLQVLEQPASDIPGSASQKYQNLSIMAKGKVVKVIKGASRPRISG